MLIFDCFFFYFSKYDGRICFKIDDFIEENDIEKKKAIICAEREMLKQLSFKLNRPTVFVFIELYSDENRNFAPTIQRVAKVNIF